MCRIQNVVSGFPTKIKFQASLFTTTHVQDERHTCNCCDIIQLSQKSTLETPRQSSTLEPLYCSLRCRDTKHTKEKCLCVASAKLRTCEFLPYPEPETGTVHMGSTEFWFNPQKQEKTVAIQTRASKRRVKRMTEACSKLFLNMMK